MRWRHVHLLLASVMSGLPAAAQAQSSMSLAAITAPAETLACLTVPKLDEESTPEAAQAALVDTFKRWRDTALSGNVETASPRFVEGRPPVEGGEVPDLAVCAAIGQVLSSSEFELVGRSERPGRVGFCPSVSLQECLAALAVASEEAMTPTNLPRHTGWLFQDPPADADAMREVLFGLQPLVLQVSGPGENQELEGGGPELRPIDEIPSGPSCRDLPGGCAPLPDLREPTGLVMFLEGAAAPPAPEDETEEGEQE